jgi:hypothetical protein
MHSFSQVGFGQVGNEFKPRQVVGVLDKIQNPNMWLIQ